MKKIGKPFIHIMMLNHLRRIKLTMTTKDLKLLLWSINKIRQAANMTLSKMSK